MKVKYTAHFEREAKRLLKKHRSLALDLEILIDSLIENPTQGIFLGKNCYKIRLAISSKGRGKSGGGRVITCLKILEDKIYLLSIFDKSEKEDIGDVELDEILRREGLYPEE